MYRVVEAERRSIRIAWSATSCTVSLIYDGQRPGWMTCISKHNLNWILDSIGSQCSCRLGAILKRQIQDHTCSRVPPHSLFRQFLFQHRGVGWGRMRWGGVYGLPTIFNILWIVQYNLNFTLKSVEGICWKSEVVIMYNFFNPAATLAL